MKGLTFSEPMVKAWLAGKKTVTRRLITKGTAKCSTMPFDVLDLLKAYSDDSWKPTGILHAPLLEDDGTMHRIWPRLEPGETVYIKETWIDLAKTPVLGSGSEKYKGLKVWYRADNHGDMEVSGKWKSPRFMPERASRSHALIVSARPERIQEITTRECVKEGTHCGDIAKLNDPEVIRAVRESGSCLVAAALLKTENYPPRKQFQTLWESLHPGSWERNDWVWRYELEKLP